MPTDTNWKWFVMMVTASTLSTIIANAITEYYIRKKLIPKPKFGFQALRAIVRTGRKYVKQLASKIKQISKRKSIPDWYLAYVFVRDKIKYVEDPDDYWQPVNITLKLKRGDCEDKATLLAAILEELGYKTGIVIGKIYHKLGKPVRIGHALVYVKDLNKYLDPSCKPCKRFERVDNDLIAYGSRECCPFTIIYAMRIVEVV